MLRISDFPQREDFGFLITCLSGCPSQYNAATMNTVDRIKAAAEEARRRGGHPSQVHLTVDDGRKLQFELITENPKLGHRIEKQGVRNAVKKVAGLEVVWRSPEFKVT